jgi:CcmD family protein
MTPSEKYTAAAYLVVFVGVLAYVLIISSKLQRLQRQVQEIVEDLRERIPELDEREREREREREPELERG